MTLLESLVNSKTRRKGDVLLLMVANYYGKGATIEEARANCKKAGGMLGGYKLWYSIHPDTTVDGMGGFIYPGKFPPILMATLKGTKLIREHVKEHGA